MKKIILLLVLLVSISSAKMMVITDDRSNTKYGYTTAFFHKKNVVIKFDTGTFTSQHKKISYEEYIGLFCKDFTIISTNFGSHNGNRYFEFGNISIDCKDI